MILPLQGRVEALIVSLKSEKEKGKVRCEHLLTSHKEEDSNVDPEVDRKNTFSHWEQP